MTVPISEHKDSLATKSCSAFKGNANVFPRGHTAIDLASLENQLDLVNILKKSPALSSQGLSLFETGQSASHVSLWVHLQNIIN